MSGDPTKALDAQADAFAQLLALSGDLDQACRDAATLARGLKLHIKRRAQPIRRSA
jgi:hypothetical protein